MTIQDSGDAGRRRVPGWLKATGAGLLGFVIGAGAAGSAGEKATTETKTQTVAARAVTTTRTVRPKTRTVTKTVTRTASVASSPSGGGRSFSGNGGKTLPKFTVSQYSTLKWTNDGDIFMVSDDNFDVSVNSQGHSGETSVPPGSYRLDVNAMGNWTIKIVPES